MFDFLSYGFFDDPYTLSAKGYHGQDRMSPLQFAVMGTIFVLIILYSLQLKKKGRDNQFLVYKILAVVMPGLEAVKILFSSYYDILNGEGFNWGGILPLYTCSMLLYFLPFVAWGKGRMQRWSMAFFCTVGIVAGLSNFIYLSAAGWYPIFTFGGLYSVMVHAVIVFVGMSLMITGEYVPTAKSVLEGVIPVWMFSVIVIPVNFIIKPIHGYVDYMLLMNCNGFKYIGDFAESLAARGCQWVFSLLMLFVAYPFAAALVVGVAKSVALTVAAVRGKTPAEAAKPVR